MLRWIALSLLAVCSEAAESPAYTPEQLTALPVSDWITNGGNIHNQRFSPLTEITANNVGSLKADWQTHLNGSGVGPPFSGEAQPIVENGVIYVPTGADDVFAIDAGTGKQLWVYQAHLEKTISTVCCGWTSRGVAIGEGKIFLCRLDGAIVALDQRTGKQLWSVQAERLPDGFTITSAPLYYDGMIISGFAGGELAARRRVRAFKGKAGGALGPV